MYAIISTIEPGTRDYPFDSHTAVVFPTYQEAVEYAIKWLVDSGELDTDDIADDPDAAILTWAEGLAISEYFQIVEAVDGRKLLEGVTT